MRWIKSWLTMQRGRCLFVDQVSGKEVFLYTDCYGQRWMAEFSRWGFRVQHGAGGSENE